jgi:serine/threonine protein kinase
MLGQLLDGRYLVETELGAGGFGKTYRAKDTRLPGQPICVVKQLKPQSSDPYFLKVASRLFEQEAEVLQKLGNHPQIPRLLAHFEQNKEFFLVQEFIDGGSLTGELSQGRKWSEAEVKKLLEQVLTPLAVAHQQKVIHRDIKPDNLMRRKVDGQIFLIDFGAVKQVVATQVNHLKQSTTVGIGTEGYTPIEQALGKPHLGGSDIYALGIVALQALTGTRDARDLMDANTAQVRWRHLVTVNQAFAVVLDKMVANAVVNRYQSATEVMNALQNISSQTGVNSAQVSASIKYKNVSLASPKNKSTLVKSQKKLISGIAIVVILLAALSFIIFFLSVYLNLNLARVNSPVAAFFAGAVLGPLAWLEICIVFIVFFFGFLFGQIPFNYENQALIGLHITILFGSSITWGIPIWIEAWRLIKKWNNGK